jgi:hypothetical protein
VLECRRDSTGSKFKLIHYPTRWLVGFRKEEGYTLVFMWGVLEGLGIAFVIFVVLFVIVDFAKHRKE